MGETIGRIAALMILSAPLGACGLSFPMPSLLDDEVETTGSISLLREPGLDVRHLQDLDEEDWRRAKGAMALALDPQGAGTAVAWDNPASQKKGIFTPSNAPSVENSEICRTFVAEFSVKATGYTYDGKACRVSGEDWTIKTFALKAPSSKGAEAKPSEAKGSVSKASETKPIDIKPSALPQKPAAPKQADRKPPKSPEKS